MCLCQNPIFSSYIKHANNKKKTTSLVIVDPKFSLLHTLTKHLKHLYSFTMFDFFKRNFELDRIPDMTGKVAIITGASSGVGQVSALELARKGAHVFLACRTESKTTPVIEEIKRETGNDKVEFLPLDLTSLQSVKKAADIFKSRNLPLHILLNNAGIMACPFALSSDGIESQFATNHVGHFYFTILLLSILEASAPSRIINVSSEAHRMYGSADLDLNHLNDKSKYDAWKAYGRSKQANVLFTAELYRRLEAKGVKNVYVNTAHPGIVKTEITRSTPIMHKALRLFMISPQDGAISQLYASASPAIEEKNIHGKYFVRYGVEKPPSKYAQNSQLAVQLWDFTESLLKEKVVGYSGADI